MPSGPKRPSTSRLRASHDTKAPSRVLSHEVLTPVFASLALVFPAALAVSELVSLRQSRHRNSRARRAIRRRVLLLFTASGLAFAIVLNVWPA